MESVRDAGVKGLTSIVAAPQVRPQNLSLVICLSDAWQFRSKNFAPTMQTRFLVQERYADVALKSHR